MAASYDKRDLYGGAITVELPSNYIDTSTIRQIPDHQEVYLAPTTLSSFIFEINTYQSPSEIRSQQSSQIDILTPSSSSSASSLLLQQQQPSNDEKTKSDHQASVYHFLDPVLPPDKIDPRSILQPRRITLASTSLGSYPAYLMSGTVISAEVDKKASSALPREWAQTPPMTSDEVRVWQLLVRMEGYGTDFCVRANVPMKEFVGDEGSKEAEVKFVEEVMRRVVSTLDVVSFDLFGGEEDD